MKLAAVLGWLWCAATAGAVVYEEDAGYPGLGTPVDQAVGDLDGLSTSLRRREMGLRYDGEQTSLIEIAGEGLGAKTYYRLAPGLRARVDRMDYAVRVGRRDFALNIKPRVDGEFVELIPANTVFELRHPLNPPPGPIAQQTGWVDQRITTLIDGRIDTRVLLTSPE